MDLDPAHAARAGSSCRAIDRDREIYDALVMALRDYMRKTGFTRAIVPVSGGIDSALALAIAVDALGAGQRDRLQPAVASTTPRRPARSPQRLAAALGVRYGVSRSRTSTTRSRRCSSSTPTRSRSSLTRENLHARIRGLLMMAESNDTGALLISCGNETEIALGYATLYGDMCGGISLIGDLSKIDVYGLARYVNRRHGREMIPRGDVHASSRRRSWPRTSSTRSTTRWWRRSSASSSSAARAPQSSCARFEQPRARSRPASARCGRPHASTTSTRARDLPRIVETPPAACAVRSTSGSRGRRSSPSRARVRLRSAGNDHQRMDGG